MSLPTNREQLAFSSLLAVTITIPSVEGSQKLQTITLRIDFDLYLHVPSELKFAPQSIKHETSLNVQSCCQQEEPGKYLDQGRSPIRRKQRRIVNSVTTSTDISLLVQAVRHRR